MLTDKEIDCLPTITFQNDPQRRQYRRAWGFEAGLKAFARGVPYDGNPFVHMHGMPMHDSWCQGWTLAQNKAGR